VWFGSQTLCLNYARRHISDSAWIRESVDCANDPGGEYPNLRVDANELPHVAYYDAANFTVKYAVKNAQTRSWNTEFVDSMGISISGQHNSMEFDANGSPAIVYLDQGNSELKIAERNNAGLWDISVLESGGTTSLGRPSDLEFDQFGNPWVAYNSFSSFDRTRLQHRDTTWRLVAVSSQGRIANAFDLEIVDGDLFLIGQKSQPNNKGLAMLYAQNGVFVDREEDLVENTTSLTAFPNPFTEELTFHFSLPTSGPVSIDLYTLHGKKIFEIQPEKNLSKGEYEYPLSTQMLPAGIYFVELTTASERITNKLIRIK